MPFAVRQHAIAWANVGRDLILCHHMASLGYNVLLLFAGKARRLKQAKEEATAEIDAYKNERERQYREHESKVCIT